MCVRAALPAGARAAAAAAATPARQPAGISFTAAGQLAASAWLNLVVAVCMPSHQHVSPTPTHCVFLLPFPPASSLPGLLLHSAPRLSLLPPPSCSGTDPHLYALVKKSCFNGCNSTQHTCAAAEGPQGATVNRAAPRARRGPGRRPSVRGSALYPPCSPPRPAFFSDHPSGPPSRKARASSY